MLIIKQINPTGAFSYGRSATIGVERRGLVNLVGVNEDSGGDSNGSGKSSLFNVVCEVLFGENPTGVSGAEVVNQVWGQGMASRVEFVSWEGIPYRVTYCREWKEDFYPVDNDNAAPYRGTTLFMDKWVDGCWRDSRGPSMAETRKAILAAVGVSYGRFVSVSYLSHRVGSRFLRGTNKDRVDILSGITGVEEWDKVLSNCRTEKGALQAQVGAVQSQIDFHRGALEELQRNLKELSQVDWETKALEYRAALAPKELAAAALEVRMKGQEKAIQDLVLQQQAVYSQGSAGVLSQEIADLSMEEARLRNPVNLEASLPQFDPRLDQDIVTRKAEVDAAKGQIQVFLRKGDLRGLEACPTCGTRITAKKKAELETALSDLQARVVELDGFLQEAVVAREEAARRIQEARKAAYDDLKKKADEVAVQIVEKRSRMADSASEWERLGAQAREASAGLLALQREHGAAMQEVATLRGWYDQCAQAIERKATFQKHADERIGKITEMESSIASSRAELEVVDWLISNIPFIKLHRLSVTMVSLSQRINQYLSEMGDTVRVNVSSFEEKKSSKGAADMKDLLKSEVKVEVVDGAKNIDPRLYSDGEVSKLSNAIVRSLHDLALQSGHGCNLILLDEIFAFVDQTNGQRIAESFKGISAWTTLITDNSGHVNNLLTFNETWTARKRQGLTTLEV